MPRPANRSDDFAKIDSGVPVRPVNNFTLRASHQPHAYRSWRGSIFSAGKPHHTLIGRYRAASSTVAAGWRVTRDNAPGAVRNWFYGSRPAAVNAKAPRRPIRRQHDDVITARNRNQRSYPPPLRMDRRHRHDARSDGSRREPTTDSVNGSSSAQARPSRHAPSVSSQRYPP